jgi:hypothetical protein
MQRLRRDKTARQVEVRRRKLRSIVDRGFRIARRRELIASAAVTEKRNGVATISSRSQRMTDCFRQSPRDWAAAGHRRPAVLSGDLRKSKKRPSRRLLVNRYSPRFRLRERYSSERRVRPAADRLMAQRCCRCRLSGRPTRNVRVFSQFLSVVS